MTTVKTKILSRPSLNLEKCLVFAHNIYDKYGSLPIDEYPLVTIFGNRSIRSGTFNRSKGALSHFNLLTKYLTENNSNFKLTSDFLEYVAEKDLDKKQNILSSFLFNPLIFQYIKEINPDLNNINQDFLIKKIMKDKKVTNLVAQEVVNVFAESYDYFQSSNKEEVFLEKEVFKVSPVLEYDNFTKKDILNNQPKTIFEIKLPFSNDEQFLIQLPANLHNLKANELEEILEVINLANKRVEQHLKK